MCEKLPKELLFTLVCGHTLILTWPEAIINNVDQEEIIKWEKSFFSSDNYISCPCKKHILSEYEAFLLENAMKTALSFHKENRQLLYRLGIWK